MLALFIIFRLSLVRVVVIAGLARRLIDRMAEQLQLPEVYHVLAPV